MEKSNDCMFVNKQFSEVNNEDKNRLVPLMKAIENHCHNVFSTDALLDLFAGGGALSAGSADCIKRIYMHDKGAIPYVYFALPDVENLYLALVESAKLVFREIFDVPMSKILYGAWYDLDIKSVSKHKINEVFQGLLEDADQSFDSYIYYYCSTGLDDVEDYWCYDLIKNRVRAGLMLILLHGSVNTAGKSISYNKFINFIQGIKDMERFVESTRSVTGFKKALQNFFCTKEFKEKYGRNPKGSQSLCKLFSTATALSSKVVDCDEWYVGDTYLLESFIEGNLILLSGTSCLIVADQRRLLKCNRQSIADFYFVRDTVKFMQDLDLTKAPYIVLCDGSGARMYDPAIHSKGLNLYSINFCRWDCAVVEYIITNIELPTGPYTTLPEDFKELAMENYKKALKNGLVPHNEVIESDEDFDKLGESYLPLHRIKLMPVDEKYRREWAGIEAAINAN